VGTTVQLYLDGQVQTEPGGSGQVQPDGCTSDPEINACFLTANHTYTAVAVDQSYGEASGSVAIGTLTCAATAAASSAQSGSGGGSLAFTGANIVLLVAAGVAAVLIGNAIVRLSRQRRQARR
jgi:hypothetical protein